MARRIIIVVVLLIFYTNSFGRNFSDWSNAMVLYSTNIPNQYIGVFAGIYGGSLEYFVEYKRKVGPNTDYIYEGIDRVYAEKTLGTEFKKNSEAIHTFHAGKLIRLKDRDKVMPYIGGGFAVVYKYRHYYDNFHILGDKGNYVIEDGVKMIPKVVCGLLFQTKPDGWVFQLGLESFPLGISVGFGGFEWFSI